MTATAKGAHMRFMMDCQFNFAIGVDNRYPWLTNELSDRAEAE